MHRLALKGLLTLCLITALQPALAQAPAEPKAMTYELAKAAMAAAEASARENGWRLTIVVADDTGMPVMLHRIDGASTGSYNIALRKAMTVVTSGMSTGEYGQKLQAGEVSEIENGITFAGGVPVMRNGVLIGAVSASGARAAEDEVASLAGAAAIGN
ncbi:MAG: heme-binding protein [Pseudomonadales bacterium]|nr:heme-binding protein [Pseudomonadales bacterium]MCP5343052.1 heme-binding protein [Pseudomonadales bacterium]